MPTFFIEIRMNKIRKVLFVCTGNSCRSVAAEYLGKWLKQTKYAKELNDVSFDSAGIYTFFEKPRDGTVKYLKSKGIEVNDFTPKKVDKDLVQRNDLLLGFETKYHKRKLLRKFKHSNGINSKVYLLRKYAGYDTDLEIKDPIDLPYEEYKVIMEIIEDSVEKILQKIISLNKEEEI